MSTSSAIESLEARKFMSVSLTSAGWLHVVGLAGSANTITVQLSSDGASYDVDLNGTTTSYPATSVKSVSISGGTLNDTLKILSTSARRNAIYGGDGNDTIVGLGMTRGNGTPLGWVKLWGQDGSDKITSLRGRGYIDGGRGNDLAYGSSGPDLMDGFSGNDTLFGMDGADTINGGNGDDFVFGNKGRDSLDGGGGNDAVQGGTESDVINGGGGSDTLFGDDGSDVLSGGAGANVVFGNTGDDVLSSESPLDTLVGGTGSDAFGGSPGKVRVQRSTDALDTLEKQLHAIGDALKPS